MLKTTPKAAQLIAVICAVPLVVGGIILYTRNSPKTLGSAVKDASTVKTAATVQKSSRPAPQPNGSATSNTATTEATSIKQPAVTTKPSTSTLPVDSTSNSSPASSPAPNTPPATAPAPTFHVMLQPDQGYAQDLSTAGGPSILQLIIPFTITFDSEFVPTNPDPISCAITSAPAANSGVLCNGSQKQSGSGFLGVQYSDTSPYGTYTVELLYGFDNIYHTDTIQVVISPQSATAR